VHRHEGDVYLAAAPALQQDPPFSNALMHCQMFI
jgi:hypothetical protein